jgi:hypothetical protein
VQPHVSRGGVGAASSSVTYIAARTLTRQRYRDEIRQQIRREASKDGCRVQSF